MTAKGQKKKLALVFGNLPTVEEIDQFRLLAGAYEVSVVSSESISGYLTQTSYFQDLRCIALPDHNENTTYLPGLEKVLEEFDVVVVKERLGMYAYQAVKAKWRYRFRLVCWVDNATPFPGQDVDRMRTIRVEMNNAADAFLVQSESARSALSVEGIEEERILSFTPWVEARISRTGKARAAAAEALGLGDTDFIIAHTGQIEWEESLFDLVHSVQLLKNMDSSLADRVKIVFCGIGSFSTDLRDRFMTLCLDRHAVYVAPNREALRTVLTAADCVYYNSLAARDRVEAEPYRIVTAMVNKIPVLAARSPIVEEFIGKHRIDFCPASAVSLAKAIKKLANAKALANSITAKNVQIVKTKMLKSRVLREMSEVFNHVIARTPSVDANAVDHQVLEVETLVTSKQYLKAIDLIESIFKIEDIPVHHKANLYRMIGDCFTKLGDGESGKDAYIQAAELDPYSAKAFIGLGTVGLTKKSYDIAVLHFQKAVSLAPEDEMANLGLGLAFQGMEEVNEASRWVIKALEINPENTAALFTLVQIADVRGQFDELLAALERYSQLHPHDHNILYTWAGIEHKLGNNTKAESLIKKILAVDPLDERAAVLKKQIERSQESQAETSNA